MNYTFFQKKFHNFFVFLDNQVTPPKVTLGTENYYKSKTFNSFALIALIITFFNTIFRILQFLFNENNSIGISLVVNSFALLLTIVFLFLIGKSRFYKFGLYFFPLIPLLSIWTYYSLYLNNNFIPKYDIELFIINPTMILILGLIVAGLLLSIRELIIFIFFSIFDLYLFYGFALHYSNNWLIPRLIALVLISAFMTINAFFRITLYHFLTETNKKLTQEVNINKNNLIEERTILYSLIANLKEGVAICNDQNYPKIVNNNFCYLYAKITKVSFEINDKIGINVQVDNPFFKFLQNTKSQSSLSEVIELENKFYLLTSNHLRSNSDSNDLGVMIEIQDITDLKIVDFLEKNFRKVVMHELRTPTTSLQLAVSNLSKHWEKLQEDDRKRLLKSMENQTERFTEIIKSISDISELENRKGIEKNELDFNSFLKWFYKDFVIENDTHKLIVENSIENNFNFSIDKKMIFQVFDLILNNSKKFSSLNSEIIIKFYLESKNYFIIEIIDYGIGIDDLEYPFIFDKFFKGKSAENLSGEGLGLSIAREIMMLHDGDILINSKINAGTSVKLILPLNN